MTIPYQQYFGRFYIDSTLKNVLFDSSGAGGAADAVVLTEGYYYIDTFCTHLQAAIRAQTVSVSATVTFSFTTGGITIAGLLYDTTITYTDADLQTLLGFTGNQAFAKTYTAANYPQYTWRPSNPLSDQPGYLETWWEMGSTSKMHRSADGTVYTTEGNLYYEGFFEYDFLPVADVLKPLTGSINRDFKSFFLDVIHKGRRVKVFPDLTDSGSSEVGMIGFVDDELGPITDTIDRYIRSYDGLWSVSFFMAKCV